MSTNLTAEHGIIFSAPRDLFGYFGWPSVASMDDDTLVAVASGYRHGHICPFGKTVISRSYDNSKTWVPPRVVNDSPLDDRDAGVISLGGKKLLISWFTSDVRVYIGDEHPYADFYRPGLADVNEQTDAQFRGTWTRTSDDGGINWNPPVRMEVTAPHGPIRLASGKLLYLGKVYGKTMEDFRSGNLPIMAVESEDDGQTWSSLGEVPLHPDTDGGNYHEPHVVELPDGKLIGMIRLQNRRGAPPLEDSGLVNYSLMQTESTDGGKTWTQAKPLGFHGMPPHLIRHSSGTLICSYGYRLKPYGERIALSHDDGQTWQSDYILRGDGCDSDLGYPATVELPGGELLTVYYQKPATKTDKCALLFSRWRLP